MIRMVRDAVALPIINRKAGAIAMTRPNLSLSILRLGSVLLLAGALTTAPTTLSLENSSAVAKNGGNSGGGNGNGNGGGNAGASASADSHGASHAGEQGRLASSNENAGPGYNSSANASPVAKSRAAPFSAVGIVATAEADAAAAAELAQAESTLDTEVGDTVSGTGTIGME